MESPEKTNLFSIIFLQNANRMAGFYSNTMVGWNRLIKPEVVVVAFCIRFDWKFK